MLTKTLASERVPDLLSADEVLSILHKTSLTNWHQERSHLDMRKIHYRCRFDHYDLWLSFNRVDRNGDSVHFTLLSDDIEVKVPHENTFIQVELLSLFLKLQGERNKLDNVVNDFIATPQLVLLYKDSFKCLASPEVHGIKKISLKFTVQSVHFDDPVVMHYTLGQYVRPDGAEKLHGLRIEAHTRNHHSDVSSKAPCKDMHLRQLFRYLNATCFEDNQHVQ